MPTPPFRAIICVNGLLPVMKPGAKTRMVVRQWPMSRATRNVKGLGWSMITDFKRDEAAEAEFPDVHDTLMHDMAGVFKLLADRTRLRILVHLARHGEAHVRSLCELVEQSQPAVSHHLALLREAGLLVCRRDGKHNFYRIVSNRFQLLFDGLFDEVPEPQRRIRFENYVLSYEPTASLL